MIFSFNLYNYTSVFLKSLYQAVMCRAMLCIDHDGLCFVTLCCLGFFALPCVEFMHSIMICGQYCVVML